MVYLPDETTIREIFDTKNIEFTLPPEPAIKLDKKNTFTSRYANFLNKYFSVPDAYGTLLSLTMLANFTGNVEIMHVPPLKMNLFLLHIGKSGIRKTIPLKYGYIPILETVPKYLPEPPQPRVEPILPGEKPKKKKPGETPKKKKPGETPKKYKPDFLLPYDTTKEGLIQELIERNKNGKGTSGTIIVNEFSGIIKMVSGEGYLRNFLEFLSELYDGNKISKRTVGSHYTLEIDNYNVNYIACSTPYLLGMLGKNWFIQGTGNRFLYHYSRVKEYEIDTDIERVYKREFIPKNLDDYQKEIEGFAKDLAAMYELFTAQGSMVYLELKEDAAKYWIKLKISIEEQWKEKSKDEKKLKVALDIAIRQPLFILKLSGLFSLSRQFDTIKMGGIPGPVILSDVVQARKLVSAKYEKFRYMLGIQSEILKTHNDYK